jgi:N-acetylneuraminate synthase
MFERKSPAGTFAIEGRAVGPGCKPLVIAEVAQAHDGSLGAAHAFVDLAADCGADAIKFQTHIAAAESTVDEPFRVNFSYQDGNRYDYWRRMEFSPEGWAGLADHARRRGLLFLSSPFSLEAVELLEALEVPAWKVASGEVQNWLLIDAMLATKKPILLSSGMSTFEELAQTVNYVQGQSDSPLAIFQCTTMYPTPLEDVGLNVLSELADRFNVPVGLSDHSADVLPSIAAMVLGASLIEVHLTLHRAMFGPDTAASLVPEQLAELCRGRDAIFTLLTQKVDKNHRAATLKGSATLFGRSLALKHPQKAGTVLTAEMLTLKKPGFGLPPSEINTYVGRRLAHDVGAERLLRKTDLEG